MAGGSHEPPSAASLLLELAAAIPPWHYLLGSLLVIFFFLYNFLEFHLLGDALRGFRGDKVLLTFNPASEICHGVVSRCRILHRRYLATPWLSSPHFQTAFISLFGNPPAFTYRRQMFTTSDGETIALDWLLASDAAGCSSDINKVIMKDDTTPIVVMVPGLASDSAAPYMKHLVNKIGQRGWNAVACNHRGFGGVSIMSNCFYHAGWTEDVRNVIQHLHQQYPKAPLFAVGTSIGANVLVKYLGEDGEGTPIAGAASICSPWDLVISERFIRHTLVRRLYDRAIANGLKCYAQLHRPVISRLANWEGIKKSRCLRDYDNAATCLLANYETVDTYYRCTSSVSFVGNVAVPLLCISALDDPVCTKEAIPWDECRANKNIVLATTPHGGHLGFFEGITARSLWWVRAVDEFLGVLHSSPFMHGQKRTNDVGLHSSLESPVDKAPYVSVMEDGRVTALGNDTANHDSDEDGMVTALGNDTASHDSDEGLNNEHIVDNGRSQDTIIATGVLGEKTVANKDDVQEAAECPRQKTEDKTHNLDDVIAPVKGSINQLSRLNTKSMWRLAYLAMVTTWPLVGSALLLVFKRRFQNIQSAAWLRR